MRNLINEQDKKFDDKFNKLYRFLFLDNDLYYRKDNMTDYLILTPKELKQLKRKTAKRIKFYNKNIKEWAGFNEEDIEKLERD